MSKVIWKTIMTLHNYKRWNVCNLIEFRFYGPQSLAPATRFQVYRFGITVLALRFRITNSRVYVPGLWFQYRYCIISYNPFSISVPKRKKTVLFLGTWHHNGSVSGCPEPTSFKRLSDYKFYLEYKHYDYLFGWLFKLTAFWISVPWYTF